MPSLWSQHWLQEGTVCLWYSVWFLKHRKATHGGLHAFGCSGRPLFDEFNTGIYTIIDFSVRDLKTFSNAALSRFLVPALPLHFPPAWNVQTVGNGASYQQLEIGNRHSSLTSSLPGALLLGAGLRDGDCLWPPSEASSTHPAVPAAGCCCHVAALPVELNQSAPQWWLCWQPESSSSTIVPKRKCRACAKALSKSACLLLYPWKKGWETRRALD